MLKPSTNIIFYHDLGYPEYDGKTQFLIKKIRKLKTPWAISTNVQKKLNTFYKNITLDQKMNKPSSCLGKPLLISKMNETKK